MSDGDNATPGRRSAPERQRATGSPQSTRGAAPWERWQTPTRYGVTSAQRPPVLHSRVRVTGAPPAEPPQATPAGSHTGGAVTVADLIAKVGAAPGPGHRRAAPDSWPPAEPPVAAYAAELGSQIPDLDDLVGRRVVDEDVEPRPITAGRVPPTRIGDLPPAPPTGRPPHRPWLLAGRVGVALIAVLALALTGGAWQWSASKNNKLNTVAALDPDSRDIVDPGGQYGDENFLIVGADTRAGANSEMGAGDTEDAGGARSDTIMLVNIPANRKRVVVVSFPRDLAITPLYCQAWNPDTGVYGPIYDEDTGSYGDDMVYTATKLNSTYSYGGPKCLVKEIQKLSGLSINRFMAVDFVGFTKMVDALGGVEVCSTTPLYDNELGTVLDQSGRQLIDSTTALNYVRARNVSTEFNGDYGRIKRQQLFLSSLLRSLISKDTFFSLSKLNNVVNMFISNTSVDNVKTKDLVNLGQSLQGVTAGHITFVTVPTGETDENGDEPPRTTDMRALFNAIIDDDPLPGENDQNATSAPTTTSTTTTTAPSATAQSHSEQVQEVTSAPQDVTVQVSNATGESGLAADASDAFEQRGFNVMSPDDYPSSVKSTTVFFSPGNEQAAATVASALTNAPIQRIAGKGQVVQVVLGPDFRSVSAPAPSGSSVNVHLTHGTSTTPTELPDDLTVTNAADTTCE